MENYKITISYSYTKASKSNDINSLNEKFVPSDNIKTYSSFINRTQKQKNKKVVFKNVNK